MICKMSVALRGTSSVVTVTPLAGAVTEKATGAENGCCTYQGGLRHFGSKNVVRLVLEP